MLNIIKAVDFYLATVSLKGHANDLLQIHLMMSIVNLQKVDGSLLKTKCASCVTKKNSKSDL
jgi:hypothetical protein